MVKIVKDVSILRQKSEMVASVEEATSLLTSLKQALEATDNGIGLAAIQIGYTKKVGLIRTSNAEYLELINPELIDKDFEFIFVNEGCLSFPNEFKNTNRYRQITIKNNVIDGDKFREEIQVFYYPEKEEVTFSKEDIPLTCIAVQHELDHFDGKLFSDYNLKIVSKIGRNDKCSCGSGKKFKKCCLK